ncbi:MAG: AraC family transcriptional regulator [Deltaproteobacteria bacterium]
MTDDAADSYRKRFRAVLEHIDEHLDEELTLDRLSSIAAFSKYHFHRQFSELFGIAVHRYVQLVRSKRASYQLAFGSSRIIEIALTNGYESHEAFSRAFKKTTGQTPSEFRGQPEWEPWHATHQHLRELRNLHMKPDHRPEDVKIVLFPETHVGTLQHRGDPARIEDSIAKFIAWRKQHRLSRDVSATFNLLYNDPMETPSAEFRLDLCAATTRPVAENRFGVVAGVIPAGRCAVLRHQSSDDTLGVTLRYLYSSWLPSSGEELRDFPLFVQRLRFFPDVPEQAAVSDVFLPLK